MKKLFSVIVVAALATSFASCGSGDADKVAAEATRIADSTRVADSLANAAAEVVAVPDTTAAAASTEVATPAH